ncbi:MAG: glycoside hydrolase family 5 protein, partial [Treponema sp.]|nr:glycoside hydrolase family 5 protein [Treponema sp.]
MKNSFNLTGIIVLYALFPFLLFACSQKNDDALKVDASLLGPYSPAFTSVQPFNDVNAAELVARLKIGWNLGNTLDAVPWSGFNPLSSVWQIETLWVKHITTKENIDALKKAGFNVLRIPVSWSKVCNPNFIIRKDWMERVTEIVNYAVENDMYVILNTHHDESIFKFRNHDTPESLKIFEIIWTQIASQFKNYNEKLIFEGLNEPRSKNSSNEWTGGTVDERNNLNKHHQVFVDTVRKTGGNNEKRLLMITPYAASTEVSAINGLVLPDDIIENKLIVSVHSYSPYDFALNVNSAVNTWSKENLDDTSPVTDMIDRVYEKFVKNGIPVILGEFGAMNKDNEEDRARWAEFYTGYARGKGIPCVWWDNGAF